MKWTLYTVRYVVNQTHVWISMNHKNCDNDSTAGYTEYYSEWVNNTNVAKNRLTGNAVAKHDSQEVLLTKGVCDNYYLIW